MEASKGMECLYLLDHQLYSQKRNKAIFDTSPLQHLIKLAFSSTLNDEEFRSLGVLRNLHRLKKKSKIRIVFTVVKMQTASAKDFLNEEIST